MLGARRFPSLVLWASCALLPAIAADAQSTPSTSNSPSALSRDDAVTFLRANLREQDRDCEDTWLAQQVQLAFVARQAVPWGASLADEMFLHFVVPYAQANEAREDWRTGAAARFLPKVADCKTPGEAALRLNATIFGELNVHYSTQRKRADQAPSESIEQGKASCTGLSILLADVCRACCIPARLVSVRWPHKQGNHTWVEVWDGTDWRFVGADEPDPAGFDRAWFTGDAAQCADADAAHRIWALSFAPTDATFELGWAPSVRAHGIDVTSRYAKGASKQDPAPLPNGMTSADAALAAQFDRFFAADAATQATFEFDRNLDAELKTREGDARLRKLAFEAWKRAPHASMREDFAADRVRAGGKESPYTKKNVGEKPGNGWGLVIAMHGGGGVPKEFNDSQWRHMQIYYKDHPEAGGYVYCALRAPTDEWNGFYTDYFYPVLEQLIAQMVVCADVDPDKVVAIGYSHGGYGAFAVGPKLPHRFSAAHASASAPSDGQTVATGLHTLPFTFMVGGKDTMYGRRDRCVAFGATLDALRAAHPGLYANAKFTLVENNGHTGLPDRDLLTQLVPLTRTSLPRALRWELTDGVVADHYWLSADAPVAGRRIEAKLDGNEVQFSCSDEGKVSALLDARIVDMAKDVVVVQGDTRKSVRPEPSLGVLCRTLANRRDPQLAASWILPLR